MTFRDCNGELSSYKFLRMCVVTTTTQPSGLYKRINHTSLSQLPTAIHSYDHTDWYVYVFIFLHSSTGHCFTISSWLFNRGSPSQSISRSECSITIYHFAVYRQQNVMIDWKGSKKVIYQKLSYVSITPAIALRQLTVLKNLAKS